MNIQFKKLPYLLVCCLCLSLLGCEQNSASNTREITVDTNEPEDTVNVVKTGRTAEDRLEEFRGWLNSKTDRADTSITREWPEVQEGFKNRTAAIERNLDSLSTESKAEYAKLKERYESWEQRQERRQQTPLDAQKLSRMQEQLLRDFSDINAIGAAEVREAYLTFMGTVRARRQKWTQDDWDYVDHVYGELNQRRREVESQVATADKLKIRALQAEYLTLEGIGDASSMVRNTKK